MAFELRQELKLTQQLVMTPQLQLAIKLLQMCKMELVDVIQQEMTENPVLEEVPESESDVAEEGIENIEEIADTKPDELSKAKEKLDLELKDYIESSSMNSYSSFADREVREGFEVTLTRNDSLVDHLMWQLHMNELPDEERKIGEIIIGNFNQDGYLQVSLIEIAKIYLMEKENESGCDGVPGFKHLNWLKLICALQQAGKVLGKIQEFDPVGVACRDLKECLLIQIKFLKSEGSLPGNMGQELSSFLIQRKSLNRIMIQPVNCGRKGKNFVKYSKAIIFQNETEFGWPY